MIRHWFWHCVAVLYLVLASERADVVEDWEWQWYLSFMARHGFKGCP